MAAITRESVQWRPHASVDTLRARARLLAMARAFFAARDILEVETPLLGHAGAADAQLAQFTVDHPTRLYLQSSPEYAMKRLLIAGTGSIYQICKAFRRDECGTRHNPEFTLIEWYRVGWDHHRLIDEACTLISTLIGRPMATPMHRTYRETFATITGIDVFNDPLSALQDTAIRLHPACRGLCLDRDGWLDLLMTVAISPALPDDRLTVITDYPASQAALAHVDANGIAERFEIYCGALELANGFHEATTAADYQTRFSTEARKRACRDLPAVNADQRLLAALAERHLPPCAGVALGFDRVVMVALGTHAINDVLSFAFTRA